MAKWTLDRTLENDTLTMTTLGLCQMRLMKDARWPWVVLVPQRAGAIEFHDLTPLDLTMLTFEMGLVGKAVKAATRCHKINIAALGNQVPQLHVHVIARETDDPAWPKPVWGAGEPRDYGEGEAEKLIDTILKNL